MQTTRSSGPITPSATQQLGAGDAGGAGRLAAEAAGADLGLGVEDLLVGHFAHHAVAARPSARRHLFRFTGRLISMALAIVEARRSLASSSA